MAGVPGIVQKYPNTQNDLLYNILLILANQTGMDLTITQYYPNTTHDLLGNIYVLMNGQLSVFLAPGAASYAIAPNMMIDKFLIIAATPINFTIGTAPGLNDILDPSGSAGPLAIAGRQFVNIDIDGGGAGTTIYFGGVLPDTLIKPYIR